MKVYLGQIWILPKQRICDFKFEEGYILKGAPIEAFHLSHEQLCSFAGKHVQIKTDDTGAKVLDIQLAADALLTPFDGGAQ